MVTAVKTQINNDFVESWDSVTPGSLFCYSLTKQTFASDQSVRLGMGTERR